MKALKSNFLKSHHFIRLVSLFLFLSIFSISAKSQVIVNVGNAEGAQNVAIDITIENWVDIVSAQFSINWDPTYVTLDSTGNVGIPQPTSLFFGGINNDNGVVGMSWFDQTLVGTNLPDGSVLFTLYFTVVQEGFTEVLITDTPTAIEFSGVENGTINILPHAVNNGSINGAGNLLTGNIYHDLNDDCNFQAGENGLEGWIIKLNADQNFYTTVGDNGDYSVLLDPDDYIVELIVPNSFWSACTNFVSLDLNGDLPATELDIPVQSTVDCPLMQVDVSTPFLRRCFNNVYNVNYCNIGTIEAINPSIEIELDPFLSVVSSSATYTINSEGLYVFNLANLESGDCGSFSINTFLDCDNTVLGQTHCVTAHGYPDVLCTPPDANWSGASLKITGDCNGSEVQFNIENLGEDMLMESQYIVIEDAVMHAPMNFTLVEGGSMPVSFPANGSTYRLEVVQVSNHPGNSMPSLAIEGCGTNDDGEFSTGFINQFSANDVDPWVSVDCQENIGSYDPNDKASFPKGYGEEHLIKPNIEIEYKIRFQNTGTDTAFNVVIEDTLSTFLDAATVRPGVSSHPYHFELTQEGLLIFSFDNIMLPDSNINEVASHGFVKFKVDQLADLPDGTLINNEAAIYFDFNDAVWTNTAFLKVQRDAVIINTENIFEEGVAVDIYPNPFSESTTFEIKGKEYKALSLKVYDAMGRLVSFESFNQQKFEYIPNDLAKGLHFYQIWSDDTILISTGKLMIH